MSYVLYFWACQILYGTVIAMYIEIAGETSIKTVTSMGCFLGCGDNVNV